MTMIAAIVLTTFQSASVPLTPPRPVPLERNAVTPDALAAAQRLLNATDYDKLMDDTIETMIAGQRAGITQRLQESMGDEADAELVNKVSRFIEDEIRAMFRENDRQLRDAFATLYAGYYTADELNRLTELQSDPVMKKSNKVMPSLMNELMTLMRGVADKHAVGMQDRMIKLIEDHVAANPG